MIPLTVLFDEVQTELTDAEAMHPEYNSAHEAYAVILEEIDEFWDEVKLKEHLRNTIHMRRELIQVATTALRTIRDLDLRENHEQTKTTRW